MASAQTPDPRADADFKLSITRALADQLHSALERLNPAPLSVDEVAQLQQRPGVYVLFVDESRVYVGKADNSLPARLMQHMQKLSGRIGPFSAGVVTFICLYVDEDLEASAPEKLLIKTYQYEGGVPWNNNGFGNKDPGRNRDTTTVKANHFDALYPINLNFPVAIDQALVGDSNVLACLTDLKKKLPYLLRFGRTGHTGELQAAKLTAPAVELPLRQWMKLVVDALPGWLATALPGYVILYKEEDPDRYHSAIAHWRRKADGVVIEAAGQAQKAPAGVIDDDEDAGEVADASPQGDAADNP